MADPPLRAVLAEDSVLLRAGLTRLLEEHAIEVVAAVPDAAGLVALVERLDPDVCVLDVRMPPGFSDEGVRAAADLRAARPDRPVLLLSQAVEERYASDLLADGRGGLGYLLKDRVADVGEFIGAVRRVAAGATVLDPEVVAQLLARRSRSPLEHLTPREREVLGLMAEGRSNSGIAERLVVSDGAVEKHISRIFTKLGLDDTAGDHRRVLAVLTWLQS